MHCKLGNSYNCILQFSVVQSRINYNMIVCGIAPIYMHEAHGHNTCIHIHKWLVSTINAQCNILHSHMVLH